MSNQTRKHNISILISICEEYCNHILEYRILEYLDTEWTQENTYELVCHWIPTKGGILFTLFGFWFS
jgi:hypothetical protein